MSNKNEISLYQFIANTVKNCFQDIFAYQDILLQKEWNNVSNRPLPNSNLMTSMNTYKWQSIKTLFTHHTTKVCS